MRAIFLMGLVLGSFEIFEPNASERAAHVGVTTFPLVLFDFGTEM